MLYFSAKATKVSVYGKESQVVRAPRRTGGFHGFPLSKLRQNHRSSSFQRSAGNLDTFLKETPEICGSTGGGSCSTQRPILLSHSAVNGCVHAIRGLDEVSSVLDRAAISI